ncbi:MAG: Uma2 family endonuclease [Acidobacteriota bacterium]
MASRAARMTVDEFFASPEDEQFGRELLDGELVPMADPDAPIPELSLEGCEWLSSADLNGLPTTPPEIAIEIVTTQYAVHIAQLTEIYLQAGVKSVWIVYPDLQLIDIYHPDGQGRRLHTAAILTDPD